jgi:hypothetical protein
MHYKICAKYISNLYFTRVYVKVQTGLLFSMAVYVIKSGDFNSYSHLATSHFQEPKNCFPNSTWLSCVCVVCACIPIVQSKKNTAIIVIEHNFFILFGIG